MKTILFSILIAGVLFSFTTDNGRLSGSIIYQDSYESSKKADAGSVLYILSEADLRASKYSTIDKVIENFRNGKSQNSIFIYSTADPVRLQVARDNFDTLSKITARYIAGFMKLPGFSRVVTNGAGSYELNLKPGKYFILAVSGNVKSNNPVESRGNIDYQVVDVKPTGETFVNFNFERSENIMKLLITSWQGQGC
jgi:hypothetical protein